MEEDEVSMSSAAVWGRRVLLRVRMLGACYMGFLHGSLFGSRVLGGLGGFFFFFCGSATAFGS